MCHGKCSLVLWGKHKECFVLVSKKRTRGFNTTYMNIKMKPRSLTHAHLHANAETQTEVRAGNVGVRRGKEGEDQSIKGLRGKKYLARRKNAGQLVQGGRNKRMESMRWKKGLQKRKKSNKEGARGEMEVKQSCLFVSQPVVVTQRQ